MVRWFANNPIAANLVMVVVFFGGLTTLGQLDKEVFPQRKLNQITISVAYPGANPGEIETQIVLRIEEALGDMDGIDEMRSTASEGMAQVVLDVSSGQESQRLVNEVKTRVDSIKTLPTEAERPVISERAWRDRMISLVLAGDLPEAELKALGETIREELAALPSVSIVELRTPRADELSIEVDEHKLRAYGLRFDDIADAVRQRSVDLPGGKLKTSDGDVQIQSRGQAETAHDFASIAIRSDADGKRLLLGDVATVTDGFEEIDIIGRFDGRPSYAIDTYVTDNPDVLETSADVKAYVAKIRPELPAGVELLIWRDMSKAYRDRFRTLTSNGLSGLLLVFLLLLLFLRPLLAAWVCAGIAVAFLGAIWLLPVLGTSLNLVSLFAFIMILGIVVDDAIIVGEAIYTQQTGGHPGLEGAVRGAQSVMKPVVFAVISTMLFFVPFYFMPEEAAEPVNLADVVMLALAFSLFESLFILPSHLAHMPPERPGKIPVLSYLEAWREKFSHGMAGFVRHYYQPVLRRCLEFKGLTLVGFIVAFTLVLSSLIGGWINTTFFPRVPSSYLVADVKMQEGTPFSEVERVMDQLVEAAKLVRYELNQHGEYGGGIESAGHNNSIRVTLQLLNAEQRNQPVDELRDRWRDLIGPVDNARDVNFTYTIIPLRKAIEIRLSARELEALGAASADIKAELQRFDGIYDVRDSLENPLPQVEIRLKPHADSLGISLREVARQVRQAFYGEEIQRIPRPREDVRVMLRYPLEQRRSLHDIRELRIRTADGREVPFEALAEIHLIEGYARIDRVDRRRVASVTAEVQQGHSAGKILSAVLAMDWDARHPQVLVQKEGEQARQAEFLDRLIQLMLLSLILIYGLMAVVFRSYWQPVLIMSAIPFGFMGGLFGHLVAGQDLAMFSMLGMVACAGVVVNDNLVLVDRINQLRDDGVELLQAVVLGSEQRFRPIILTSLTTFIGLTPIMLESSIQAQFLKPMVIALAFGVSIATFVTLLFVPALYLFGEQWRQRLSRAASPVSDDGEVPTEQMPSL